MDLKNIGNMLAGYSAGSTGQLPAFVQNQQRQQMMDQEQQQRNQISAEERMNTYFTDAAIGLDLINQGNIDGFLQLGAQRLQLLQNFPDADPSDTQILMQLGAAAKNGSREALEHLKGELQTAVTIGKGRGVIKTPQAEVIPGSSIVNGQVVTMGADGRPMARAVGGFQAPTPQAPEGFRTLEARAAAAGLQPGTPEYQRFMTQSGSGTTVNVGGELDPFEKKIAENQASTITTLIDSGLEAGRSAQLLTSLESALANVDTGIGASWQLAAGNFGIPSEGLSELQAAEALINQLVPAQRPPGSGTMSDADLALFKRSLPRIINQPGGNQLILGTMRKINEYTIAQGAIAQRAANGEISRQEAGRMLMGLPNPLEGFQVSSGGANAPAVGAVVDGYKFKGGNPADQSSWERQ